MSLFRASTSDPGRVPFDMKPANLGKLKVLTPLEVVHRGECDPSLCVCLFVCFLLRGTGRSPHLAKKWPIPLPSGTFLLMELEPEFPPSHMRFVFIKLGKVSQLHIDLGNRYAEKTVRKLYFGIENQKWLRFYLLGGSLGPHLATFPNGIRSPKIWINKLGTYFWMDWCAYISGHAEKK